MTTPARIRVAYHTSCEAPASISGSGLRYEIHEEKDICDLDALDSRKGGSAEITFCRTSEKSIDGATTGIQIRDSNKIYRYCPLCIVTSYADTLHNWLNIYGGDEESRTPVRKCSPMNFSECSPLFGISNSYRTRTNYTVPACKFPTTAFKQRL